MSNNDPFADGDDDLFGDACEEVVLDGGDSAIVTGQQISGGGGSFNSAAEIRPMKSERTSSDSQTQNVIYISIPETEKIGDGMGAYVVFRVNTKTSLSVFRKPELSVRRRFSDFLGLHTKLQAKHLSAGIVIPPPPEKSLLGMTKIKMSKEDGSGDDFIERRRASLERYLRRLARHERLCMDPDFREFLEHEGDLPRSSSTQALSGASVMRLFKNVNEAMGKMTFRMEETDEWFEDKQIEIENLEKQMIRLHSSFEALVGHRKELASNTSGFARSCSLLSNVEEHTALARALSQLAETEERIEQIHSEQADSDFYTLTELLKDYLALIASIKETLHERVKTFKNWKDAEATFAKKREQKVKLELANKFDKVPAVEQEIREYEHRVERGKEDFEEISEAIKKELAVFDIDRVKDFKQSVIKCLEVMVANQEKVIQYWEAYLPEAKAIV